MSVVWVKSKKTINRATTKTETHEYTERTPACEDEHKAYMGILHMRVSHRAVSAP